MRKLILHIGFNKTGSTSIQKDLVRNAAALEQIGYLYPGQDSDSFMQNKQHTPLASALPEREVKWVRPAKRSQLNRALPDLLAAVERSSAPNIILSSEAFGGTDINNAHVQQLCSKLPAFDITAIAYIRRQDNYIMSTYQESIKNGASHPFEFKNFHKNRQLSFSRRLAPWREVLGHNRVVVRPFSKVFWPQQELFFDFLTAIGAPYDNITPSCEAANSSLDYRSVEVLRRFNNWQKKLWPDMPLHEQKAARIRLMQSLRKLEDNFTDRGKMRLSSAQSEHLRQFFYSDNCASLDGSGVDVEKFFPHTADDIPARMANNTLSEQLLMKVLATQVVQAPFRD